MPGEGILGPPLPSGPIATLSLRHATLKGLLTRAYSLRVWQIAGPSWLESTYYDVTAKVPTGARPQQVAEMLRNLLADRFDLRIRWETKSVDGWALVAGPSPLKLKRTALPGEPTEVDPDGVPGRTASLTFRGAGGATVVSKGVSMHGLAQSLWADLSQPVQDFTGLKGAYDITLEDDRESILAPVSVASMKKALRAYGLDLVRRKVQAKTLRVESAVKTPKPN